MQVGRGDLQQGLQHRGVPVPKPADLEEERQIKKALLKYKSAIQKKYMKRNRKKTHTDNKENKNKITNKRNKYTKNNFKNNRPP